MKACCAGSTRACPPPRDKVVGTPHSYVSGPHTSDYYFLLDEQSDYIFATRLAEHIREAICDRRAGLATASLPEIWIDETEKHVWYVFEADRERPGDG